MSARRRPMTGTRCVECRKPIAADEPIHTWEDAPGLLVSQAHRRVTYARHAACQELVERQVAESRRRAEADHQAALDALRARLLDGSAA